MDAFAASSAAAALRYLGIGLAAYSLVAMVAEENEVPESLPYLLPPFF